MLVCPKLRAFPRHRTFSAKTRDVLSELGWASSLAVKKSRVDPGFSSKQTNKQNTCRNKNVYTKRVSRWYSFILSSAVSQVLDKPRYPNKGLELTEGETEARRVTPFAPVPTDLKLLSWKCGSGHPALSDSKGPKRKERGSSKFFAQNLNRDRHVELELNSSSWGNQPCFI